MHAHISHHEGSPLIHLVIFQKQTLKKGLTIRARRPKRLPVVLTREETQKILSLLSGVNHLMASFLYGSGLRLMECLRLRIKDIDFSAKQIIVRDGKGSKDRVTILPELIIPELSQHLVRVKALHDYSEKYGKYRIIHIKETVDRFIECGDYSKGIARIKCTNPNCGHEYFRPFSCKSWYLCPSCNQKRLLLFSEHLSENVLLKLPHRQFVFTVPKLLRPYLNYDRNLFEEVTKIMFSIIHNYYIEAVKTTTPVFKQSSKWSLLREIWVISKRIKLRPAGRAGERQLHRVNPLPLRGQISLRFPGRC